MPCVPLSLARSHMSRLFKHTLSLSAAAPLAHLATPSALQHAPCMVQAATLNPKPSRAMLTRGCVGLQVTGAERRLRAALLLDGLKPQAGYKLARYNDPFTLPFLRRNEILILLDDFELD